MQREQSMPLNDEAGSYRDWIREGLIRNKAEDSVETIEAEITSGRSKLWGDDGGVIVGRVTTNVNGPHLLIYLVAGDFTRLLVERNCDIETYARETGCAFIASILSVESSIAVGNLGLGFCAEAVAMSRPLSIAPAGRLN